jgi:hypothetical protein
VPGTVRRFETKPGLKIPHMGWNSVVPRRSQATGPGWVTSRIFTTSIRIFRCRRMTRSSPRKPSTAARSLPPRLNCRTC